MVLSKIGVALVGVGNCASALVQGIQSIDRWVNLRQNGLIAYCCAKQVVENSFRHRALSVRSSLAFLAACLQGQLGFQISLIVQSSDFQHFLHSPSGFFFVDGYLSVEKI